VTRSKVRQVAANQFHGLHKSIENENRRGVCDPLGRVVAVSFVGSGPRLARRVTMNDWAFPVKLTGPHRTKIKPNRVCEEVVQADRSRGNPALPSDVASVRAQ